MARRVELNMEENKPSENSLAESVENLPVEVEGLPKELGQVPLFIPQTIGKPLWRYLMSGVLKPRRTTPKVKRFWYNGNLITKEEHDKLTVEEIYASNNKC